MPRNKYTFKVPPVPASRPRVTRWGVYYGKVYTKYLKEFEALVRPLRRPWEGNLYVVAEFICHRPKKVTRANPRGDIDNYAKALFDAMTKKGFWVDDDQIVHTTLSKRYADLKEEPHTKVEIYHHDG